MDAESVFKTLHALEHRHSLVCAPFIYRYIQGKSSTNIKKICPPIQCFKTTRLFHRSHPLVQKLPVYSTTNYCGTWYFNLLLAFEKNLKTVVFPIVPDIFISTLFHFPTPLLLQPFLISSVATRIEDIPQ